MKSKMIFLVGISTSIFATEYKHNCPVPHSLIETVRQTENESANPFLIRTNESKSLNKFYEIANNFQAKKTKDPMVINCLSEQNCTTITRHLISNGLTNIDLGLFQINYDSFPFDTRVYFNERYSYRAACSVILEKIKMKKNWSWETLASYHSVTPHLNKIYKEKLINNYMKITRK